jgi:hypothetical protein
MYKILGLYTLKVKVLDKLYVSECIIINGCGLLFKLNGHKAQ